MEYLLGGSLIVLVASAGALIWYLVRHKDAAQDRAAELDRRLLELTARAAELELAVREQADAAKRTAEDLRLAHEDVDRLERVLATVREQRDQLLHAAAAADPGALADAVRDQLRALEALREGAGADPRAHHDPGAAGGDPGAVHGAAAGGPAPR